MNLALFRKTMADHRLLIGIIAIGLLAFPTAIINAFASFPMDMMKQWLEIEWISRLIRGLAGADFSEMVNTTAMGGFAFVHPVILAITWSFIVVVATRVLAGEIDQGTADLLLALPVSRWSVYTSVSACVFLSCLAMTLCTWLGVWIGNETADLTEPLIVWQLRHVAANQCAMLMAVAGLSMLIGATGSRRGHSVGLIFGILVTSFLLNWLAMFWERAQMLAHFAVLHYFQPFAVVRDGRYPAGDIAVLLAVAAVTWTIGGFVFARKDIRAS